MAWLTFVDCGSNVNLVYKAFVLLSQCYFAGLIHYPDGRTLTPPLRPVLQGAGWEGDGYCLDIAGRLEVWAVSTNLGRNTVLHVTAGEAWKTVLIIVSAASLMQIRDENRAPLTVLG